MALTAAHSAKEQRSYVNDNKINTRVLLDFTQSSGSSTIGLLGLFSISHSPNRCTASLPDGFSLHICINPVTRSLCTESEPSPTMGFNIISSNWSPVGLFLILLIIRLLDSSNISPSVKTNSIVVRNAVRFAWSLVMPAADNFVVNSKSNVQSGICTYSINEIVAKKYQDIPQFLILAKSEWYCWLDYTHEQ